MAGAAKQTAQGRGISARGVVALGVMALAVLFVPGGQGLQAAHAARAQTQTKPGGNLPPFDAARAFSDLKHQADFGPRPAGSAALAQCRQWIESEISAAGLKPEEDKFTAATPVGDLEMANVVVRIPGSSPNVVIVSGHYDTKRFDRFKFVGANDGASSAAMLLELARAMAKRTLPYTLWFVWFDGEEAVREQWEGSDNDYGSRQLVERLSARGELSRVKALILVDMIGDAKLDVRRDPNSTPWLTELEFGASQRLGYGRYFLANQESSVGGDDYDPWLAAGVPSVDIIDFNYGPNSRSQGGDRDWNIYWHTAQDTVAHCSPQSLEVVGRVVLEMLQELGDSPHLR
jgi:glutaminyl-peptide cyclotransferase